VSRTSSDGRSRGGAVAAAIVVLVLAAVVVWRAGFGIGAADDPYYAAATLRFAGGARPFVDEMFLQSLGFLPAVPLVKLWLALFGSTGVVYALRASYVLFAGGAGWLVYRALRPSFSATACALAAAAPLLALPYGIVSPSYNTFGLMGMTTALALAFAAVRDDGRASAAGAGVAMAIATIAYPPFVAGSLALLISVWAVGRRPRVVAWMLAGAVGTGALAIVGLAAVASVDDVRRTLGYTAAVQQSLGMTVGAKVASLLRGLRVGLVKRYRFAMWVWYGPALLASVAASLPWVRGRLRGALMLSIPALVALPVLALAATSGGTLPGNYLIALTLFLIVPSTVFLMRRRDSADARLVALAAASSLVNFLLVAYVSNASLLWASPFIGLAPLTASLLLVWAGQVEESLGARSAAAGSLAVVCLLSALLFSVIFQDGSIRHLTVRVPSGPLEGIATTPSRAAEIEDLTAIGRRYTTPNSRVLCFGLPIGYLVMGGTPLTNATYLSGGPADASTVAYYQRRGEWPDVAFVRAGLVRRLSPYQTGGRDPLIDVLEHDYRRAAETSEVVVFVRP
jgi:hypothetical protein